MFRSLLDRSRSNSVSSGFCDWMEWFLYVMTMYISLRAIKAREILHSVQSDFSPSLYHVVAVVSILARGFLLYLSVSAFDLPRLNLYFTYVTVIRIYFSLRPFHLSYFT